ncbi:AT-hook motif nuclear-localized protein 1-like [Vigna unguiculata]|uniref:AT-hook motif nuclear-localized protein 1-like n=1 Tax=Vigna unguiculata TaxID=3917 RepID=UPI0010163DAF|nr:AT-hook motif nuclear-localized protein 1-like [Vigna unguiculata]
MEAALSNSTISAGSAPPPSGVSQPMNMNVNMNMNVGNSEGTTAAAPAPAPAPASTPTTMVPAVPAATTTTTLVATTPGSTGGQGSFDLFGKKKRGRPRKYDADGNLRVSATPTPAPPGFTLSTPSEFSNKRGRGKHTAFGNYQLFSSFGEVFANTAAGDFIPHVVTVYTGEDVAGKILSFAQKGPRGICILSANGAISNVTIRQPGSSGGILTYEGRFEILSLSGSFTVADNSGMKSRTGGLSVSLAGPDGRVIGGGVAGLLTAAGPIQIVVGSFTQNAHKSQKKKYQREQQTVVSPTSAVPETVTFARPISQANAEGENFLMPMSQIPDQTQRESVSVSSDKQNLDATLDAATWNGSEEYSDQRTSPDINISLPDE